MLDEPRAGRLAAWGNALLAGLVSPDDAATRVVGDDTVHRVVGLPEEPGPVGLTLALGRLRASGVVGLRIALPAPGHPLGLCGPPAFNVAALAAGEAVLAAGSGPAMGLVPEVKEAGPAGDVLTEVVWRCLPVLPGPLADVPSLGEAERELAEVLRDATEALTRLDVAGAGPMARTRLEAYRARMERGRQVLAPGYPPRAAGAGTGAAGGGAGRCRFYPFVAADGEGRVGCGGRCLRSRTDSCELAATETNTRRFGGSVRGV